MNRGGFGTGKGLGWLNNKLEDGDNCTYQYGNSGPVAVTIGENRENRKKCLTCRTTSGIIALTEMNIIIN